MLSSFLSWFVQWVRMNTKGRQAKGKARLARYESLTQEDEAADAAARASLESIFIPPGPLLGTTVVEAKVSPYWFFGVFLGSTVTDRYQEIRQVKAHCRLTFP